MVTVVSKTIGATARDYSTLVSWEGFSDTNLVGDDEQHDGVCYDDADFGEQLEFNGATTDATRYRSVFGGSGQEFDPIANTGLNNTHTAMPLRYTEGYARFSSFRLENTYNSTLPSQVVLMTSGSVSCRITRCFIYSATAGGTGARYKFTEGSNTDHQVWNCIAHGDGGTSSVTNEGFNSTDAGDDFFNCVAYDIDDGASHGDGINVTGTVRNCIAMDMGDEDFKNAGTSSNNCSSDATATGSAPPTIKTQTATDIFTAPGSDDFTLKTGSNAIDVGLDLSSTFTDDFDGTTRTVLWDMGAYDEVLGSGSSRRVIVSGG
jgi:hypothetical protein